MTRLRDNAYWGAQLEDSDAIAGYLNFPGATHAWTDAEWAQARSWRSQKAGRKLIGLVFLGTGAGPAVAECRRLGLDGVGKDWEGQYTGSASAAADVQSFGDGARGLGFPSVLYSSAGGVVKLVSHYDYGWAWWNGPLPNPLADRMAYQNVHQSSYDESQCGAAFLGMTVQTQSQPPGSVITVADLDQNFINRGLVAWFLDEHGVQPTGPNIDWFLAHAHDVGAGQVEWAIEGALAGSDTAEAPQIGASASRLRQLGQGQIPADMQNTIKALAPPPAPVTTSGQVPPHSHTVTGTTSTV